VREPLTVATFKWNNPGYRSKFGPESVNTVFAGFKQGYKKPFRMVCITDDAEGIDPEIGIEPIWYDHADVPSPHGNGNPSCYRRLKAFAPEMREILGPRVLLIDLDNVPIPGADLTPLFDRPEPIVLLKTPEPHVPFNGSMVLMDTGAFPEVWETFDPNVSPRLALAANCHGSDQGWLSYLFRDRNPATWRDGPGADGIYVYRRMENQDELPDDARLVLFHGKPDYWEPEAQAHEWVRRYWPVTRNEEEQC
jgi:hypothetical protein